MLLHFGSRPTLIVSSPEFAKQIMNTHDVTFANRPPMTAGNLLFYGSIDIVFSPYGEYFRQVKKMCVSEILSVKRVQSFQYVRAEEIALVIEKISVSSLQGASINLTEILLSLSNDIVSRCALGRKFEHLHGENKFGGLSREAEHLLGAFSFGDLFPWLGWMDVLAGLVGKIEKISSEIDIFLDEVIDEHVMQIERVDSNDKKDFVDLLLKVQSSNKLGIRFTRDNVKAVLLDMFIGGTDTTSIILEWSMAELVKNPRKMKKAQEEVRRVVGDKSKVSEEEISQMIYLKCILKETLRLHPPAPLLAARESTENTNMSGFHVPCKTSVLINAWAIHRDPEIWNNPEAYIPERFINNPTDFIGRDYDYIPFGAGRRGCPGMAFGMAVTELVLANLLYWFDWILPSGTNAEELDMSEAFGLTAPKKIPLHLIPLARSSS